MYACEFKVLWREVDHHWPLKAPKSEERGYALKYWMLTFLGGLNPIYEDLGKQILHRERVPSLDEAIHMLHEEQIQLSLHTQDDNGESTALSAKKLALSLLSLQAMVT